MDGEKIAMILKCFNWGVPFNGIAEICNVNIKTVRRIVCMGGQLAKAHHNSKAQKIEDPVIQLDELRAKKPKGVLWVAAAIASRSRFIVGLTIGKRDQRMADRLLAQVSERVSWMTTLLSDGWRPYVTATIKAFGRLYRPRRRGARKKAERVHMPEITFGQVIKDRGKRLLKQIRIRSVFGKLKDCVGLIGLFSMGQTVHTAYIERAWGSFRCRLSFLRRKSRCLLKNRTMFEGAVWLNLSFHNWIRPHQSLSKDKPTTPAMAAGLSEHVLSWREYVQMPVYPDLIMEKQIEEKVQTMGHERMVKAVKRSRPPPPDEKVVWSADSIQEAA